MKESLWNDFRRIDFEFEERDAILIFPDESNKTSRWLLKTEYFEAFQDTELEMVKRGYHLAYISSYSRWAPEEETKIKADFCRFLHEKYGLCEKCATVGMSCGGLSAGMLAAEYPEHVALMYLDAPVLNMISIAGFGDKTESSGMWEELKNTFGFTRSSLVCYRNSPIDHLDIYVKNKIPVIMLYGNADTTVIYTENGRVLEDYYKKNGGIIKVIPRSMSGHHPHGLKNPAVIADFIDKYYDYSMKDC